MSDELKAVLFAVGVTFFVALAMLLLGTGLAHWHMRSIIAGGGMVVLAAAYACLFFQGEHGFLRVLLVIVGSLLGLAVLTVLIAIAFVLLSGNALPVAR